MMHSCKYGCMCTCTYSVSITLFLCTFDMIPIHVHMLTLVGVSTVFNQRGGRVVVCMQQQASPNYMYM